MLIILDEVESATAKECIAAEVADITMLVHLFTLFGVTYELTGHKETEPSVDLSEVLIVTDSAIRDVE